MQSLGQLLAAVLLVCSLLGTTVSGTFFPLEHHRVKRGGLIGSYGQGLGGYSGFSGGHATAIVGGGGNGGTNADFANRAAGVAQGNLGYQTQAAWNAADAAADNVAKTAVGAAQQAQNAAAAQYSQAAATTHAAQAATAAAFSEAAVAAKLAKTVEAAEAFKQWALDQAASLSEARRYAEGNVGLSNNVFASALNAVDTQASQEWNARQAAQRLQLEEKLAFTDLESSQGAASKASSAAKTAYLRAKNHGHNGLGIGPGAGFGSSFGRSSGHHAGGGGHGGGGHGGYGK